MTQDNEPLNREDVENMMWWEYGNEASEKTSLIFKQEAISFRNYEPPIGSYTDDELYQSYLKSKENENNE